MENLKRWTRPANYAGAEWPEYYSAGVGESRDKVEYAMQERARYHWLQSEPVWIYGRMDYSTLANHDGTISNAMVESLRE